MAKDTKLSWLEEVKADAAYNVRRRFREEQERKEHELAKKGLATPETKIETKEEKKGK